VLPRMPITRLFCWRVGPQRCLPKSSTTQLQQNTLPFVLRCTQTIFNCYELNDLVPMLAQILDGGVLKTRVGCLEYARALPASTWYQEVIWHQRARGEYAGVPRQVPHLDHRRERRVLRHLRTHAPDRAEGSAMCTQACTQACRGFRPFRPPARPPCSLALACTLPSAPFGHVPPRRTRMVLSLAL
jgi:hypothetical protein